MNASRVRRVARVAFGILAAFAALCLIDWRHLAPALGKALSEATTVQALAVAILGQALSLAVCAAGLRALSQKISAPASALSRWVRDGVGAIPFGLPGMGEAAGIRVLVISGATASDALAITTTDVVAETLAQAAYAILAVLLAPSSLRVPIPVFAPPSALILLAAACALAAPALLIRYAPRAWKQRLVAVLQRTWGLIRSPRFGGSLALHALAWVLGGVQIYLLSRVIGAHLSLLQGLSLEGLVFALRAAFFFVPAGVGVQEAALAAVGAAYGLAPLEAAALALLLRLRDVVILTPGLLAWAAWEARRAVSSKPRTTSPSDLGTLPCA